MKLRIGHRTFTVRAPVAKDRLGTNLGMCLKDEGVILIRPNQPADDQACSLVHEVLHAIWSTQELDEREDEEVAVTHIANGLTQVIRDNPAFLSAVLVALDGKPVVPAPVSRRKAV